MKRYLKLFILISCLAKSIPSLASDSLWTLMDCVQYAQAHNLEIKTSELDIRSSKMVYEYSKYNRLPSLSMSSNYGTSFGRSINPTTNAFENTQFSSIGLSAGANVLVFGWFEKKYAIQKNQLQYQSAKAMTDQLKNDLALNIATAYLRVLLAEEQTGNVTNQIALSAANKTRVEKLLANGKSNMLELSQAATQLSIDSSAYLQSLLNEQQAFIDLKAILNLSLETAMQLEHPVEAAEPVLAHIDPNQLYELAKSHMPSIRSNQYKTAIALKDIASAKTNLYPKLSLYVSSGTNYSSSFYEMLPSGERQLMSFGKQFQNNISQSVGVGLSIPLFSNFSTRQAIQSAKLDLERTALADEQTRLQLKQDIYKAVTDYELNKQKYHASLSAQSNAELAFKAADTRYTHGFITHFEYLTAKNTLLKLQNETTALKYDLYFTKLKIDYFNGEFK